ncbi:MULTISPECIES: LacI family DNA-binding transcriptional regulator [Gammaproteobacteria]|uniref:LacI family transcriptional regulator n=1 Tax=Xanthomonas boreopolis TaxID=86183 RepID=A0A919KJS0_9XANT|nr:LacI family DNA-binding transcriptional regulator [Pseudomonas sp. Hp2]GHH58906.1 LacI family transcriptional regulator [[Pseudomonas] boreopolis]
MPRKKAEEPASGLPKGKAATINDIARLSGVSKKTVSRIINNSPLVRQDTREKVEALMREVGYAPDPLARGLAFRRSFLIGMVYDNPTAQYIVDMQYGALDALRGSSFELVVHPCDTRSPGYIEGVRRFVQAQKLHGVILVPRASEDQALADMLAEIGCRYTRIASVALDTTSQTVITHDRDGAAEAADYLLSLGHRDIALVTGPSAYRSSIERTGGFLEALQRRGIELPPERVVEAGYTFESGVAAAEKLLLGSKRRPTAIFTGNDEMAAGIYKVALRAGISIPRQLSVIGYDDSSLASRLWPPLTSVRRHTRDTGRTAAAMLIQPEGTPMLPTASVRPHLIVRDSCQPPED